MSTPPDQSLLPWITAAATLGSAVVGGLIGVAVTWQAHYFTDKRERRKYADEAAEKRRERLRGKLEEIVTLVLDHSDALSRVGMRTLAIGLKAANPGSALEVPPNEQAIQLDRAEALQGLYFPTLSGEMAAVRAATQQYRQFNVEESNAIVTDIQAWNRDRRPTYGTRGGQVLAAYRAASIALILSARTVMDQHPFS